MNTDILENLPGWRNWYTRTSQKRMAKALRVQISPRALLRHNSNMFEVYVIQSQLRNYIYVGLTNDLLRRFNEHQRGFNKTTRSYRPFNLIYNETFPARSEARKREKYLKSGIGKAWIKTRTSQKPACRQAGVWRKP